MNAKFSLSCGRLVIYRMQLEWIKAGDGRVIIL